MDISNQERLKILDGIKTFVNEKEQDVILSLQSLGWNIEHIKKKVFDRILTSILKLIITFILVSFKIQLS